MLHMKEFASRRKNPNKSRNELQSTSLFGREGHLPKSGARIRHIFPFGKGADRKASQEVIATIKRPAEPTKDGALPPGEPPHGRKPFESSEPGEPDPLGLFVKNRERQEGSRGQYFLSDLSKTLDEIEETNPDKLPAAVAEIVNLYQMDAAGWKAFEIAPKRAESVFNAAVLISIDRVLASQQTAQAFVDALDAKFEASDAKADEDLIAKLPVWSLNMSSSSISPQAITTITLWALKRLPEEFNPLHIFVEGTEGLGKRSGKNLHAMANAFEQQGVRALAAAADDIADVLDEVMHVTGFPAEMGTTIEEVTKTIGFDSFEALGDYYGYNTEIKEAVVTRVLYGIEPGLYKHQIIVDTLPTFQKLLNVFDMDSNAKIQDADADTIRQLIYPAGVIQKRVLQGSIAEDHTYNIANAILERAKNLQRVGELKIAKNDEDTRRILSQQDTYKVISARSEEAFWDRLSEYAEWNELNPANTSTLYERWRATLIRYRKNEHTRQILAQEELSPETLLPETLVGMKTKVTEGSIVYDSIGELIADMRKFFIPLTERIKSNIVAKGAIAKSLGNSDQTEQDLLSQKTIDAAVVIMDRLEEEIREWDAKGAKKSWGDSADKKDYKDPYNYSGGLFTGYGIGAYKGPGNKYHLTLQGRDYAYNPNNPTDKIEDYAAFVKKEVSYTESVNVTYIAAPSDIPQRQSREGGDDETTIMRISLQDMADSFGSIFGLTEDEKQQLMQEAKTRRKDSAVLFQKDGLKFSISEYDRGIVEGEFDQTSGEVITTKSVFNPDSDHPKFFLPRIEVKITGENQSEINRLGHLSKAVGEVVKRRLENEKRGDIILPGFWSYDFK